MFLSITLCRMVTRWYGLSSIFGNRHFGLNLSLCLCIYLYLSISSRSYVASYRKPELSVIGSDSVTL